MIWKHYSNTCENTIADQMIPTSSLLDQRAPKVILVSEEHKGPKARGAALVNVGVRAYVVHLAPKENRKLYPFYDRLNPKFMTV